MSQSSPPSLPSPSHRHIEVFQAVMTTGSVTGAAQLLHSSQPTVSRELARMELLLGYPLFERQGGRLRPTTRAMALFDEVQRAYHGLQAVTIKARQLAQGSGAPLEVLSLPALAHALLPGALARWRRQAPEATLSITPQESPRLEEWMSAQRFDLGLNELDRDWPGVRTQSLLRLDEVAVLSVDHPLARQRVLEAAHFASQPFISLALGDPYRQQIDALFDSQGVSRQLRLETHSAIAVCALVQQGLGLAIVNPLTAMAFAGQGLVLRRLAFSIPFGVSLLEPLHRPRADGLGALVQALEEEAEAATGRLVQCLEG